MTTKRGSILAETVLVMPLLLALVFGVVQFALLWTAKQMTAYAAFCAARAVMVAPPNGAGEPRGQEYAAQRAAEVALSWMCIADDGGRRVSIPGWGEVHGSGSAREIRSGGRVQARILENGCGSVPAAAAEVKFRYPLLIPGLALDKSIELSERCILPMPYSTANFPAKGFDGTGIHGER